MSILTLVLIQMDCFCFKFIKELVNGDKGNHIFMKLVNRVGVNQNVKFQLDEAHYRVLVIPKSNSNLPAADFRGRYSLDKCTSFRW